MHKFGFIDHIPHKWENCVIRLCEIDEEGLLVLKNKGNLQAITITGFFQIASDHRSFIVKAQSDEGELVYNLWVVKFE